VISVPTDFYFLGDRTYVHGPTILGCFLSTVERTGAKSGRLPARVITCRFRRLVQENCVVACGAKTEPSGLPPGPIWATATIEWGGVEVSLFLIGREIRAIERRLPYDEAAYLTHVEVGSDLTGSAMLQFLRTKKDVIRGIVALTKVLHVEQFDRRGESKKYRWIFSSTDNLVLPGFPAEESAEAAGAKARLRLAVRNVWEMEGRMYTVSGGELEYRGGGPSAFTIGFAGYPR
jgi:hypothetical protein